MTTTLLDIIYRVDKLYKADITYRKAETNPMLSLNSLMFRDVDFNELSGILTNQTLGDKKL